MDMTIRPSVMLNACVAGIAALLVGCGGKIDPNPPSYSVAIPTAAAAPTVSTAISEPVLQAGIAIRPGANSALYATGKADSVEACVAFGREALYAGGGAGLITAASGNLTCFGANNKPITRFVCKADAGCTQVMGFN